MKAVFADTAYYLALINPDDRLHGAAVRRSRERRGLVVLTGFILVELADGLSHMNQRRNFISLLANLRGDPHVQVIPVSEDLFERGVELYSRRADKDWSLTDCISFVVMKDYGLDEALTHDRHFAQAGFRPLLAVM